MLFAGALVLTLLGVFRVATGGGPEHPQPHNALAVLPFSVSSGAGLDYLSEGAAITLSRALDESQLLRPIDPNRVLSAAESVTDAGQPLVPVEVAKRVGAETYLVGTIVEAGGRLEISAATYSKDGRLLEEAAVEIDGEAGFFDGIGRLAVRLLSQRFTAPSEGLIPAAARATANPAAFRAYVRGERAFRRGGYAAAVGAFEEAARLDSTFGLAFYRLGVAADWAGWSAVSGEAFEAAWVHRERLGLRERRLMQAARQPHTAETLLHEILARDPTDAAANFTLADLHFHRPELGVELAEVKRRFKRVLAADTAHPGALLHLARLASVQRRPQELDLYVDRALRSGLGGWSLLELRLLRALAGGSVEAALDSLGGTLRALDDPTLSFVVARALAYSGQYLHAPQLVAPMLEHGRPHDIRAVGRVFLAHAAAALGRVGDAHRHLAAATSLSPRVGWAARAFLLTAPHLPATPAELAEARAVLANWNELPDPPLSNQYARNLAVPADRPFLARALLSVRLGDQAGADSALAALAHANAGSASSASTMVELYSALFTRTEPAVSPSIGRYLPQLQQGLDLILPAEIAFRAGRDADARAGYDILFVSRPQGFSFEPLARERLARLYDRAGDAERAIQHYARFVELWRDADPPLQARVDSARRRLADLRADSD